MIQIDNANIFNGLHIRGQPVVLYNAWDAGSAAAIAEAGAKAIATSSAAVASAQGHDDGENLPLDLALQIVSRIVETVDVPVTVDFEGGYSDDDRELASNISKLLDVGVVGINFEDRLVKGKGMYGIEQQMKRIAAIRKAAEKTANPRMLAKFLDALDIDKVDSSGMRAAVGYVRFSPRSWCEATMSISTLDGPSGSQRLCRAPSSRSGRESRSTPLAK